MKSLYFILTEIYIGCSVGRLHTPLDLRDQELFFNPGTDIIDFWTDDAIWLKDFTIERKEEVNE